MMSLLFLLFLVTLALALVYHERLAIYAFGIAMVVSILWFHHHASTPLAIQL
ncbi:MAG: DUF5993 family protein [Alphaproteobacteria bacterium]|nr:DUF5993 family protein [Alphaproteobacteria bacterium]